MLIELLVFGPALTGGLMDRSIQTWVQDSVRLVQERQRDLARPIPGWVRDSDRHVEEATDYVDQTVVDVIASQEELIALMKRKNVDPAIYRGLEETIRRLRVKMVASQEEVIARTKRQGGDPEIIRVLEKRLERFKDRLRDIKPPK